MSRHSYASRPRSTLGAALVALLAGASLTLAAEPPPEDLVAHPGCHYCGMDRTRWSRTRHLVEFADGTVEGTCSLRCLATALGAHHDTSPRRIAAADAGVDGPPRPLLDARALVYQVDPSRRGTMTSVRKWAFASRVAAARELSPEGRLTDLEGALTAAMAEAAQRAVHSLERGRRRRAAP